MATARGGGADSWCHLPLIAGTFFFSFINTTGFGPLQVLYARIEPFNMSPSTIGYFIATMWASRAICVCIPWLYIFRKFKQPELCTIRLGYFCSCAFFLHAPAQVLAVRFVALPWVPGGHGRLSPFMQ